MLKWSKLIGGLLFLALVAVIGLIALNGSGQSASPAAAAAATVVPAATPTAPAKTPSAVQPSQTSDQDYREAFIKSLAGKLGVSEATLNDGFQVALTETVDQMVKDGKLPAEVAAKLKAVAKEGFKSFLPEVGNKEGQTSVEGNPKMLVVNSLGEVARLFNLDPNALMDKMKAGQSLAEIAQAQHVDLQKLKDTILTSVKTQLATLVKSGKLTQAQADENSKYVDKIIEEFINSKPDSNQAGSNDATNPKSMLQPALEKAAPVLGISSDQLFTELQTKTLAEIAQAHNVDLQKVKDAMLNSAKTQLAEAVKAGKLTQAQADEVYKSLPGLLDDFALQGHFNPENPKK